jgi:hypothetical protein
MLPSDSPDITLVFSGLFLLAFEEENKYCQLIVLEAERHLLEINVKTQSDSRTDVPDLSIKAPDGDVFFEVTGRINGVDTYEPGPFERHNRHDSRDFRWLLDFEGRELHNHRLHLRANAPKRSVFVYDGLFYTHSAQRVIISGPQSARNLAAGEIKGASKIPPSQNALIARSVGCDIYLNDGEEFQLRYGPNASYSISLRKEPKISYGISVTNLCPSDEKAPLTGADFDLYYDIINVPEEQRFRVLAGSIPEPTSFIAPPQEINDRNPCNPAALLTSNAPLQ